MELRYGFQGICNVFFLKKNLSVGCICVFYLVYLKFKQGFIRLKIRIEVGGREEMSKSSNDSGIV